MKFKDYLKAANRLAKDHPECLNYEVVNASDDEGNEYQKVYNSPHLGNFSGHSQFGEFTSLRNMESESNTKEINAICIN